MNILAYFTMESILKKKFYNIDIRSSPQRSPSNVSISSVHKTPKSVTKSHSKEPKSASRRIHASNNEDSDKSSVRCQGFETFLLLNDAMPKEALQLSC